MKKLRSFQIVAIIGLLLVLSSCGGGKKSLMKKATGKPGSLVVVVPNNIWEGDVRTTFLQTLAQPVPSIPQDEPMLDVVQIPNEGFTDIFRTTRNLLIIDVNTRNKENQVTIAKDVWSTPQIVIKLIAKTKEDLIKMFKENDRSILSTYLNAENQILMDTYKNQTFRNKGVYKHLEKKFDIHMNVPKGFSIVLDKPDFSWIKFEARETSQGFFVWSMPYTDEKQLTIDNLIAVRDSLLKEYVPGPAPKSYMTTEHEITTLYRTFKLNGNYAVEMRGLWKVKGDFMGGPWVSISVLDVVKKRIITADGYLYSPKYDKRNLLRQVEAMLRSVTFPYQKQMDMVNKKIESTPNVTITPNN